MTQCCGECKWWKFLRNTRVGSTGRCEWYLENAPPFPDSMLPCAMDKRDGLLCPVFAPREYKP